MLTHLGNVFHGATDAEHALVDTLDNLADAGLDAGLFTQVGDVLPALADDDAGLLGGDEGAEGQSVGFRAICLRIVVGGRGGAGVGVVLALRRGRCCEMSDIIYI